MKLKVVRKYRKHSYTIGNLYIDGKFFCNTLEDADRNLDSSMSLETIKELKRPTITAIPYGSYKVSLNVISPKYSLVQFYKDICNGKVPRLLNVKGFDGILIHVGEGPRGAELTSGCILVGKNTIKGGLTESKEVFKELYSILSKSTGPITIDITKD